MHKLLLQSVIIGSLVVFSGCSIFQSGDDITIKKKPPKPKNTLFTTDSASEDIGGILQGKPGRYQKDDDEYTGTLPDKAIQDLHTLPKNMSADVAFNQLVYLFARDYFQVQSRLVNIEEPLNVSDSRKNAPAEKPNLRVNLMIIMDAGSEMKRKVPGSQQTKMDHLKQQVKTALVKLQQRQQEQKGISYYVGIESYSALYGAYLSPKPIAQAQKQIFPVIDQVLPGKFGTLDSTMESVEKMLKDQTGPNTLNQIFVISSGETGLEPLPTSLTKQLYRSQMQVQVHVIDYGVKRQKVKNDLQQLADLSRGEYITVDVASDSPFDFSDQTDASDDGYNPREYLPLRETKWTEWMVELKEEQIEELDTRYGEENDQMIAAVDELQMSDAERQKLLDKIEFRRSTLAKFFQEKITQAQVSVASEKNRLGVE